MTEAIRIENVSKRFIIHHERNRSFQDIMVNIFKYNGSNKDELWVLKDVSFVIHQGETIGIVGENGSGKSTLLKMITRILDPTIGRIVVNGRTSALLELGAGFHPDLTGRENIYLNGSVLGIGRNEMERKFDDIVEFSELERFIDTSVKHYSSGMYTRLGFSVAISVDPDILIIDEVLSVGDEAFQQKCMDKILELRHRGKTIVFVSHDPSTVEAICDRALLLHAGRPIALDTPRKVIHEYHKVLADREDRRLAAEHEKRLQGGIAGKDEESRVEPQKNFFEPEKIGDGYRLGTREIEIVDVQLLDEAGNPRFAFTTGDVMVVAMNYVAKRRIEKPVFGVAINRTDGVYVSGINTKYCDRGPAWVEGQGQVYYRIRLPLLVGSYTVSVIAYDFEIKHPFDHHEGLYPFRVFGDYSTWELNGLAYIPCHWEFSTSVTQHLLDVPIPSEGLTLL